VRRTKASGSLRSAESGSRGRELRSQPLGQCGSFVTWRHLGRVHVALEACNVCEIDVADAGRRLEGQAIGLRNRVHYLKSTALRIPLDTVEQLAADLEVLLPAFAEAAWALQGRAGPPWRRCRALRGLAGLGHHPARRLSCPPTAPARRPNGGSDFCPTPTGGREHSEGHTP
jgi:hypothetical protein